MNSIFEWGSLILIAGTVAVGVGAILTSRTIQAKQEASIAQANTKAAEATKAAAEANERAAILDKKAAEARLELARIDPLNLPIRSIRADIFLTVRGDFYDWHFDTGPVLKGGARSVNISIVGKRGALVELQCNEFESLPAATTQNKGETDGRTFSMSCAWPTSDWIAAQDVYKFWIDRNNPSTAMLDKKMDALLISLPPTKNDPEKPAEILQSSCVVTINGSIRRSFLVPKSSVTSNIFCPVKKK